jgi:hypothetical protein
MVMPDVRRIAEHEVRPLRTILESEEGDVAFMDPEAKGAPQTSRVGSEGRIDFDADRISHGVSPRHLDQG